MNERLQNYALIGEIVGAVAVVISLVYVGVGVRQNTEAIRVANHQALVAMDIEKNAWLRDSDFAVVYVIAQSDIEKLTPAQLRQYSSFMADTFNAWEFAYITYKSGAMDENIWEGWDGFYRSELESASFRWFWQRSGANFSPEFKSYVDSHLENAGGT